LHLLCESASINRKAQQTQSATSLGYAQDHFFHYGVTLGFTVIRGRKVQEMGRKSAIS